MIDINFLDCANFFIPKSARFKVDRKRSPSFLNLVASNARHLAPDSEIAMSFDQHLLSFRRFWKGYYGRKKVALLNQGRNMPIHSQHDTPPVLAKTVRDALGPNVGNALISVFEIENPTKILKCEVNAYSRNRHPPENSEIKKRKKVVLPKNENHKSNLTTWMAIDKNHFFVGDAKRSNCTENRILNGIHTEMGGKQLKGSIDLYTDRIPCSSCRTVISKFLKFHTDVKITITYAYQKEWWEGEYFEVGSLLTSGVDVTLVRKTRTETDDVIPADYWFF